MGGGAGALSVTQIANADIGFHLATGRAILASGAIPSTNVLSFTQPHHTWLLHEAASAVVFDLIYRAWGFAGLVVLKAAVVAVTWAMVYAAARRLGASRGATTLAGLMAMAAASIRFMVRPQIFSALILAAIMLCEAHRQTLPAGKRRGGLVALQALLVAVGYQLHAGAIFSVLFLLAMAAGEAFRRFGLGEPHSGALGARGWSWSPVVAAVAGVAMAALALSIYHPHGARVMLVPFQLGGSTELAKHVVEYRAPYKFPLSVTSFYWLLVVASVVAVVTRWRRGHPGWVVAVVGLLVLSLRHIRVVDSLAIVATPTVALAATRGLASARVRRLRRLLPVLLLALACTAFAYRWGMVRPGLGVDRRVWPTSIFDFLDAHDIVGPAYVIDGWAGPYLGRFYPRHRAFFDPRFEAYSPQFVTDVYKHIRYGLDGWETLLDRYGVQVVVLRYTSAGEAHFQKGRPNLRQRLVADGDWALVYFDDRGEVFVHREGRFARVANQLGVPHVDPDRLQFDGARPAACADALLEAGRRWRPSARLWLLTAVALGDAGRIHEARALLEQGAKVYPSDGRFAHLMQQLPHPNK